MDPTAPSDEFYNDALGISRGASISTGNGLGAGSRNLGPIGPNVAGTLSSASHLPGALAAPAAPAGEQRWPYGLPGLSDHAKHPSAFEPECSGTFGGLPPLSQAFNGYPPSYPRLSSGTGYMENPYLPHAMAMSQRTGGPISHYGYTGGNTNDMHYFGRSDELVAPPFVHPPTTSAPPPLTSSTSLASNSSLSTPSLTSAPPSASAPPESRLPMNGQPHRLPSAYPPAGLVHPSISSSVPVQHFWPNFTLHSSAISDRANNNGFRPSSPNIARSAPETAPPIGTGVSANMEPNLESNVGSTPSGPLPATTTLPVPYKAPKVKQIYSFVPLPGAQTQKRPRRRYDEIERIYQCGWNGCEKAYGTLNHLNAHVFMQGHGEKRTPEEFKEIRAMWRAKKKEEIKKKQVEDHLRQEENKRHTLPSPQLAPAVSSLPESQSTHSSNLPHMVYAHLPQQLPSIYQYSSSQQGSVTETSQGQEYSSSTYQTSLLPHLNQYTAHPQSYTSNNRDYKSQTEDEDRDAEGEPDPEASG